MNGISGRGKDRINAIVEEMFDNLSLDFVGNIPGLRGKTAYIGSKSMGLGNLFVQSMNNRVPNEIEKEVLRTLLNSSHGYVEALKNKTRAIITERVDGLAIQAKYKNQKLDMKDVEVAIAEEMKKARTHMVTIVESEATKLRNLGSLVNLSRFAADFGDPDPSVYFIVVKDNSTCKECLKIHLMPDGATPRLFKLSELKQGYHKRGEDYPSAFGLHPHCRCTLVHLPSGFGFDKTGKVRWQTQDYDAFRDQRE